MAKGMIVYEPEKRIIEKGDVMPLVNKTGGLFVKMGGFFAGIYFTIGIIFLSLFHFKKKVVEFQMRRAKILDLSKKKV